MGQIKSIGAAHGDRQVQQKIARLLMDYFDCGSGLAESAASEIIILAASEKTVSEKTAPKVRQFDL